MTTFDDRETAFENKFAHDEKIKFAATARACNRVALWVAQTLGMAHEDAENYAKTLALSDLMEPGHDAFLNRLRQDLRDRIADSELRARMENELATALEEIRTDARVPPG